MNQTILFTPVGGTDPISLNNYHDGSILHICRFYKPDKVILYMSKEMLDFQEKDDRYRYCLDRLAKMQDRPMIYEIIERRELTKVHEFDYFYEDFRWPAFVSAGFPKRISSSIFSSSCTAFS